MNDETIIVMVIGGMLAALVFMAGNMAMDKACRRRSFAHMYRVAPRPSLNRGAAALVDQPETRTSTAIHLFRDDETGSEGTVLAVGCRP